MSTDTILLQPRPYARVPGRLLLLPLLPLKKPVKPLPAELWHQIFALALLDDESHILARSLLIVCNAFKEIAQPLLYSNVITTKFTALEKFYGVLHAADQKWDSIRRIPYSTPGRWVQTLDFSRLEFAGQAQTLALDSTLTNLFPLVPFLSRLSINPSFVISRRALNALADKDGAEYLRSLEGLSYVLPPSHLTDDDPFVRLLRRCPSLELLELIGQELAPAELVEISLENGPELSKPFPPLNLPNLHTLSIISMHSSPLLLALLSSPLPSLRKLTITPYHDIPYPASMTSRFIEVHGRYLRSLNLLTLRSWPTHLHPSPPTLLPSCPNLHHLSLEKPLTALVLNGNHPLEILSIPRPDAESWRIVRHLLPNLPKLQVVRIRDLRWLRDGISSRAQAAGVQGEMREWARRLSRNGVHVLDADWKGLKTLG
ncbi:hypothetical protein AX14_003163 [Amanita brunnescens Koide BX004]|nr:hypothetical protein AX14_003163 [Amanita brunnescens Koide BX004]